MSTNRNKKRKLRHKKHEEDDEDENEDEDDILHPDIPMEAKFIPLSELIEKQENGNNTDNDSDDEEEEEEEDSDDDKDTRTTKTGNNGHSKHKKKNDKRNGCYGCIYLLDSVIDKFKQPHIYALKRVINECKGQMSTREYYKKISEQQYHHCVKKFENTPYCPPIWKVEMVKEHFENHVSDYKSELENDVKFLKALALEQSKTLISQHELNDHTMFDRNNVDSYLKTLKTKKELLCALYNGGGGRGM